MVGEVACVLCHNTAISVLVREADKMGICEPCSVIAHHMWRQSEGEVPPQFPDEANEVSRVYVLLARLSSPRVAGPRVEGPRVEGSRVEGPRVEGPRVEDIRGADSQVVDSEPNAAKISPMSSLDYKFVVRRGEDGNVDLPGVDVAPGEDLRTAAVRAMGLVKIATWSPDFVEPLYTAYTPRAHLATVMLVTAWHLVDVESVTDELDWRDWPLSKHVTTLKGFYKMMESVWRLRLHQHFLSASHTEAISVQVKSAGYKHIALQRGIRAGRENLDTSCMEIFRRMMSDDERAIEKAILANDEAAGEIAKRRASGAAGGPIMRGSTTPGLGRGEDGAAFGAQTFGPMTGEAGSQTLGSQTLGSQTLGSQTLGSQTLATMDLGSSDEQLEDDDIDPGLSELAKDLANEGSTTQGSTTQGSATQGSATQGSATQGSATRESAIPEGFVRRGRRLSTE